jgi:serine/threonine protein kinase
VVIGEYQMLKLLGEGTTAKVFLAEHNSSQTQIAIKRIRIDFINENASNREYFFNELQIMNKLKHPNLLHCFELYQTTNNFYILMEFCDGGSLKHLRGNQGGVSEQEAMLYMRQIMEGFKALKRHKIIHRDVKLENLLIKDGVLKIADFGTAKRGMESTSTKMIGSFLTMAPEVMQIFNDSKDDDSYSSKVDLWSIGVVFYEILFGQSPFFGSYPAQMIHNMRNNSGENLKLGKAVHVHIESLLKGLLQFNPKTRISWEDFFKHPAFDIFPLPPNFDAIYKDYKLKQFDKGDRLRKGSRRIKPRQKPKLESIAKSVSKKNKPRKSSLLMVPKPMRTIDNLSNIYKSKDKLKKSLKTPAKNFTTSILQGSNAESLNKTESKKGLKDKYNRERFSSNKYSKQSTQRSGVSHSNKDKGSTAYSRNRLRSYTENGSTGKNNIIFSKVSNNGAKSPHKNKLQKSETLPFQRNSMSTHAKRSGHKFLSNVKNYVPELDDSPEKYSKSTSKQPRKKSKKQTAKKSKSSIKTNKTKKRLKSSAKLGGYSNIYTKSKTSIKSKKRLEKSTNDSIIEEKKRKLLKKYKLDFQMRLISNRYFHEKNKILFINITLKNIRDIIKKDLFREIESNLYICVLYLMRKAIYLSEIILKSLQFKKNIFNIDFFEEYINSENLIEMLREFSDDWNSCKNYFSIFIERVRCKNLAYSTRLEEHIQYLSSKNSVNPTGLHEMLKSQFETLVKYAPSVKRKKHSVENEVYAKMELSKNAKSSSPVKNGMSQVKKKKKLETDFYKMMVQLKYSIFVDASFPYVTNNSFFDWKNFFKKFQSYKNDTLKQIIKSNNH